MSPLLFEGNPQLRWRSNWLAGVASQDVGGGQNWRWDRAKLSFDTDEGER